MATRWPACDVLCNSIARGPHFDGEGVLTADLDTDDIVRGKYDLDVVGHYARPDVFRLGVNERPSAPVVREEEPR